MKGEVLPTCNQLQYSSLFTGQCLLASCNRQQVVCSRYICDTSSTRFCKSPSCHAEAHSHGYMVPPDIALLLDHIFQLSFIPASDLGVGTDIPHPVIQTFGLSFWFLQFCGEAGIHLCHTLWQTPSLPGQHCDHARYVLCRQLPVEYLPSRP